MSDFDVLEVQSTSTASADPSMTSPVDQQSVEEGKKPTTIHFGSPNDPFFFLSTYFPCRISVGNADFEYAETMFQAAKFEGQPALQGAIKDAAWPETARHKAQSWEDAVGDDWEDQEEACMREIQHRKFAQNTELLARLLQTGDATLVYLTKSDAHWGVRSRDMKGRNLLGNILMSLREAFSATTTGAIRSLGTLGSAESNSVIWRADESVERWYASGEQSPKIMKVEPALANVDSSSPIFLHGLAHGSEPWTVTAMVQVTDCADQATSLTWWRNNGYYSPVTFTGRTAHSSQATQFQGSVVKFSDADYFSEFVVNGDRIFTLYRFKLKLTSTETHIDVMTLQHQSIKLEYGIFVSV